MRIATTAFSAALGIPAHVQADTATCIDALVASQGAPVRAAAQSIDDPGRRLLALRGWLRAGSGIEARWSWSAQRIAEYEVSAEHVVAMSEINKVQAAFATTFPGFRLEVNRSVRPMELQTARWNENASVGEASRDLVPLADALCRESGADALRRGLLDWQPSHRANLAVPGLSPHGQGRAFDFQIVGKAGLIAGTDSRRIATDWDAAGWTQRLANVIATTSKRLHGPLQQPREPWHYAYRPDP